MAGPGAVELLTDTLIQGRYRVEHLLGRGGFGAVYRALQLATGQPVALKVLLPGRSGGAHGDREVARFTREMKLVGHVSHPNVIRLIDFGQVEDGHLFTAFEFVTGENLGELIDREGALPVRECVRLMVQVLEALGAAHRQGVIHRDLKPQNIMVTDHGPRATAKVVDFGVSYLAESWRDAEYRELTAQEELAGTPHYMAPEQLLYGEAGVRSDLYAWGLVFLEALTGWPAHGETSFVKLLLRHTRSLPVMLPAALAESPLGPILAKATAFDPAARYTSSEDALQDLEGLDLRTFDVAGLEQQLRADLQAWRLALAAGAGKPAAPAAGGAEGPGPAHALSVDAAPALGAAHSAPSSPTELASHPGAPHREPPPPPVGLASSPGAASKPLPSGGASRPSPEDQLEIDRFLAAGNAAVREGAWAEARQAFAGALGRGSSIEASMGMATALFWLGDMAGVMSHLEQAFALARRRNEPRQAAEAALRLSGQYGMYFGNYPAALGWLARAGRLIDEFDLAPLRGMHQLIKAKGEPDLSAAERLVRGVLEEARQVGIPDMEVMALSSLGAVLVQQGRAEEGAPLLDEAMAAALGGEVDDPSTVVFTCCSTINACTNCADFERATQWIRASERFAERFGCPFLSAECRVVYANVLVCTGEWARAEESLTAAMAMSRGSVPHFYNLSLATLAGLRLLQGRLEEAERILTEVDGSPEALPVQARLFLLRGKAGLAASMVQRALDMLGTTQLASGLLLELLGEAQIARGDGASAAEHGRSLIELGTALGCRILRARGQRLRAMALHGTHERVAREHFDAALAEFLRLGMPYEAARTRLLAAMALRPRDPELAEAEARSALAAFRSLGAARDLDAAHAFVEALQ